MATKKVVKFRGENRRANVVYFGEIVLDGVKITATFGNTDLATNQTTYTDRIGERAKTLVDAEKKFESYISQRGRSYTDQKRTEEEVPAGDETLAAAATNPALEKEILAARDSASENAASTVYADWLQTQGDVRGELASLFLNNKEADARAWIAANKSRLFGELDVHLDNEVYGLEWRGGFLRGASLKRASIDSNTELADLTRQFLALPIARLVTELRFGLAGYESDNDWSGTLGAIADSRQAATLRSLRFDDYTYEDSEISWTAFGDFSDSWSSFPALEELRIRSGEGGTLGEIDLPNLKTFVRVSGGLGSDEIESIFNAEWPKLEHLEVWFGDRNYGAAGNVEHLTPLLEGEVPSTLYHLGLVNCEFVADALAALAKSDVLKQLKTLDCSKGMFGDDDARILIDNYAAFAHLEVLDLSENLLNTQGEAIRAKLPNAVVASSRYEEGRDRRYVALGE